MKKTLIIVAHPNIEKSVVNKSWIEELRKYPEKITVHELYKSYPDGKIDVKKEQALVEAHESLILQFPIYWFSCTPLIKQWLDDVLTYGWAYGSTGKKLQHKKFSLAVSLGASKENYNTPPYTVKDIMRPFEMTAAYINADYQGVYALYGAHTEPNKSVLTPEHIQQGAKDYIQFLSQI